MWNENYKPDVRYVDDEGLIAYFKERRLYSGSGDAQTNFLVFSKGHKGKPEVNFYIDRTPEDIIKIIDKYKESLNEQ
tara:strand:- start:266 stop:496 length:231 start_codon:yes stop_codon:yes gene_type:complete